MTRVFKKSGPYGNVYGDALNTPTGRLIWAYLDTMRQPGEPKPGQVKGKPRYEATLLFPKDHIKTDGFISELWEMLHAMLPVYNDGAGTKFAAFVSLPDAKIYDGDLFDLEKYPHYKNCWVINARNSKEASIQFLDRAGDPVLTGKDFNPGMKVRFRITPRLMSTGLSYQLECVQLVSDDGTRFNFRPDHAKGLGAVDEEGTNITPQSSGMGAADVEEVSVPSATVQAHVAPSAPQVVVAPPVSGVPPVTVTQAQVAAGMKMPPQASKAIVGAPVAVPAATPQARPTPSFTPGATPQKGKAAALRNL